MPEAIGPEAESCFTVVDALGMITVDRREIEDESRTGSGGDGVGPIVRRTPAHSASLD